MAITAEKYAVIEMTPTINVVAVPQPTIAYRPRPVIAYGLCGAITVEMPLADLTATVAYNRHEERGQVDVTLEPEPPLWHMSSQLSRVAAAVKAAMLDCRSGDDAAIRALHEAYWRVLLYREGWREAVEGDGE